MAKFDLHLHSNNSDGSARISELLEEVKNAGIEIFALTDHDTVEGIAELQNILQTNNFYSSLKFVKGVELTCKINDINCHILGYGINPESKELAELIELGKNLRRQKLETRIKFLKEVWNINLTQDEINWLYSRKSVVKTHIANILVNRGLAQDNVSAMKQYLDNCKTGNTKFDGEVAIKTIIKAGGIPIWAHPLGGEGEKHLTENEFISQLQIMINSGIQGLECYYSRYNLSEIDFLVNCAKKNNLLITGGSDWHGTNKTVQIGSLNNSNTKIDSNLIENFLLKAFK